MISDSLDAYFDDFCEGVLKKQITRSVDSLNRSVVICYLLLESIYVNFF